MPAEIKIGFILPGISIPEENKELQFTMESASTVRNVTLTLYQVVASGTTLSAWANYDPFSGSRPQEGIMVSNNNNAVFIRVISLEDGDIGDTYNVTISTSPVEENFKSAVETVLVDNGLISAPETLFDGTITITSEDTQGVEIPFYKDVSAYPFEKWTVTINGLEIPYQANEQQFMLEDNNMGYSVYDNNGIYTLQVVNTQDESFPIVPGDYQVKITAVSKSETDSDNTIYIDASSGGVATMSVDPTILYDAVNTGEAIPRVVVRTGGRAHEICDMVIPDRPLNTIALTLYTFGHNSIEGGSVSNEFYFNIDVYSFTKGNKTGTHEETKGTIPFTSQS